MNRHKPIRRILAMALSVVMAVGMLPVSAAAEIMTVGAGGEIIAFEKLPGRTAGQTVSPGTPIEELDLPETLMATVRFSVDDGESMRDSEEQEEPDSGDAPQSGEGESKPDEPEKATASSADQADESEMPEQTAAEPDWEEDGTDTVEMLIPVPVEWISSPEYDKDQTDTYVFTARAEGFTVDVPMPEITVTVKEGATVRGSVTAFEELPEEIRWQNTMTPDFPKTLSGTVEGNTVQIPVTWEADHEYDMDFPERGLYVFTAEPDEGYILADGLQAPHITVYIPQRGMARMAGGGTEASPLEITTVSQLVEIAVLVNAGRLESFLLNDADAQVSLELMNDLDLSGYGSGEGWIPVGSYDYPFKGRFDGGSHKITGLTISRSGSDYQGLFGGIDSGGMVYELGLINVNITGKDYVGGVTGYVQDGNLSGCYVTGSIQGESNVGGVSGEVYSSTIEDCYSAGSVIGTGNDVGGMTGYVGGDGSKVQNCYSWSIVTGDEEVGGVVGYLGGEGIVQNCAALNISITGDSDTGRVAGKKNEDASLSVNMAYSGIPGTWSDKGADRHDGADKNAAEISGAGFFQALFTPGFAWTYETGKLPGLSGAALDMPVHIADKGGAEFLGSGTITDPWQIRTAEEMKRLAELVNAEAASYADTGKYYKLVNGIDLSGYASGGGWEPVGEDDTKPFRGNFDGGGKVISGLFINRPMDENQGLFGQVGSSGTVQNLGLENADITGGVYVGGVAANVEGTVENCYVSGRVSGINTIGGVAGYIYPDGTVQNCYVSANISGSGNYIGGIAGYIDEGTVKNCYALGSVSGDGDVGGIGGWFPDGTVENCAALNLSIIHGPFGAGGRVVGSSYGTLSGNVAFNGIPGAWDNDGEDDVDGESKTAAEIGGAGFFQGLFGDVSVWTYANGKLPGLFGAALPLPPHLTETNSGAAFYGAGTSSDPYKIYTAAELAELAQLVNDEEPGYVGEEIHYKLMNDLDLTGYAGADGGKGWIPIGTTYEQFEGVFDGNGCKITGVIINRPGASFQGLFGSVEDAVVKNLGVTDVNITGEFSVGGLAGEINDSVIQNCYSTGIVTGIGVSDDPEDIGGIAGSAGGDSRIESCYIQVSVSGMAYGYGAENVGGMVGYLGGDSVMKNCYALGSVDGGSHVGGVAGYTNEDAAVEHCYAANSVTGDASVGGIIGSAFGALRQCAALNPFISNPAFGMGRVIGAMGFDDHYSCNTAFIGIPGAWGSDSEDDVDGESITLAQINSASFWRNAPIWGASGWGEAVWTLTEGKLPVLKHVGGIQTGDGGLYLTPRDIAHAAALAAGTHTYTGSPITPTPAVTFDSVTLAEGVDYTILSYSSNTDAGTAALTIEGIGNFYGTKNVNFTINRAAGPAAPSSVTGSYTAVGGTTFTYTVDEITGAEYSMDGILWQASNEFSGIAPESSHTFYARIRQTTNYGAGAAGSTDPVFFAKLSGGSAPMLQYTVSPGGFPKTITITPVSGAEYRFNSGSYSTVNTYNSNGIENVTLYLRLAETATHEASDEASKVVNTANQGQAAPDEFTLSYENVDNTSYTVTIPATAGAEYSFDGITWSSDNTKTGFLPGSVTGYKRMAAKPGFYESPVVSAGTMLPMFPEKTPATVSNGGGNSGGNGFTAINAPGKRPNQPVTAAIPVTSAEGINGAASVNVPDEAVTDAVLRAQADAKAQGKTADGIAVELNITLPEGTASIYSVFSPNALQSLVDAGVTRFCVNSGPLASVCLDLNALKEIQKQSSGSVTVSMTPVSNLSEGARNLIGTRPVYDIGVSFIRDGNIVRISDFSGGTVTITIPYTADPNEAAGYLYGVYVDDRGNAARADGSVYDTNSRSILISTGHLSVYGVGYTAPGAGFTDIDGHWAKENIDYVTGRGLLSGTSEITFSPDAPVTWEVLVAALGRLSGIDVNAYAADGVLSPYAEWAYEQGILHNGSGSRFAPDKAATREEAALILQRYANATGYRLPVTREAASYADASAIGSNYKAAVRDMQQAGVMMGGIGKRFNPKTNAARGEFSAMLHRYIKLTIDPKTAQGWAMNDAGQWLYFKDGLMVCGKWLQIDGKWYYFYSDGSLAQSTKVDGWEVDENGVRKTG